MEIVDMNADVYHEGLANTTASAMIVFEGYRWTTVG
jgi:hypothetical protein